MSAHIEGNAGGEFMWRADAEGMIEICDGHETILFGVARAQEVRDCIDQAVAAAHKLQETP